MADEVDGLTDARDLVDQPVDVGLLGGVEAGRERRAEAGQRRREDVAPRRGAPQLVPQAMGVGNAVDQEGGHGPSLYRARP